MQTDLPPDELTGVAERILRALKATGALSFYGLQYRLSETGHPGRRITPRLLRRALAELQNNRRPRAGKIPHHGPWKPLPDIYVSPAITRTNSEQHAAVVAATHREQLEQLAGALQPSSLLQLAEGIAEHLATELAPESGPEREPLFIGGGIPLPRPSAFMRLTLASGHPALAWITNDPDWLYPDEPWLWRHLARCNADNSAPIIIARKLAPQTFSLVGRLGAFAVELHHHYTSAKQPKTAQAQAERVDWPKVYPVDEVRGHGALEILRTRFLERGVEMDTTTTAQVAALTAGLDIGLAEGKRPQPNLLVQWAKESALTIPPRWLPEVERWTRWARYVPPRRSGP